MFHPGKFLKMHERKEKHCQAKTKETHGLVHFHAFLEHLASEQIHSESPTF